MATPNITILHNSRCGKSRCALDEIQSSGVQFELVEYLKKPLTSSEIKALQKKLGIPVKEMVRTKEPIYKDLFKNQIPTDAELFKALFENPILLERPIVIQGDKAWIVRTEEALKSLKELLK
jgi:arsenate reductase (glutaredoxin)